MDELEVTDAVVEVESVVELVDVIVEFKAEPDDTAAAVDDEAVTIVLSISGVNVDRTVAGSLSVSVALAVIVAPL